MWSQGTKLTVAAKSVDFSEKSTVQMFQYLREVCSTKLIQTPAQLDGPGVVVQIDES